MNITAIIAAAGSGIRFGSPTPKQFLDLGGKPVLLWSVEAFANTKMIKNIIIVTAEEYIQKTVSLVHDLNLSIPVEVKAGGTTRQQSVLNGLNCCPEETEWVAVHDAARPFIEPSGIEGTFMLAREIGAAIVAEPVTDTIKEASNDLIVRTIDRSTLFKAQTPQICRKDDLLAAYVNAEQEELTATDEAGLLEAADFPVAIFESTGNNFKITTKSDFYMAKALISSREKDFLEI